MSTLSGLKIKELVQSGEIKIEPFFDDQLNPNSYNLRLADKLLSYRLKHGYPNPTPRTKGHYIDMAEPLEAEELTIPKEGLVLRPGILYLGTTVEFTDTPKHVPCLEGRSSIGRVGLCIHVTAGFGDIGFAGHWTLEITAVHPVKVYPDIEICQIAYSIIEGESQAYAGKYQRQEGKPRVSEFYKDLAKPRQRYGGKTHTEHFGLCPKENPTEAHES